MIKWPKPTWLGDIYGHSDATLKQAVRDFGEQCALLCGWAKTNGEMRTAGECEAAIRALIKEIPE